MTIFLVQDLLLYPQPQKAATLLRLQALGDLKSEKDVQRSVSSLGFYLMDFLHLVAKWKMSTSSRSLDEVVLHMYSVACVCHINIVLHLNCSLLSIVCRYYINTWFFFVFKILKQLHRV